MVPRKGNHYYYVHEKLLIGIAESWQAQFLELHIKTVARPEAS